MNHSHQNNYIYKKKWGVVGFVLFCFFQWIDVKTKGIISKLLFYIPNNYNNFKNPLSGYLLTILIILVLLFLDNSSTLTICPHKNRRIMMSYIVWSNNTECERGSSVCVTLHPWNSPVIICLTQRITTKGTTVYGASPLCLVVSS